MSLQSLRSHRIFGIALFDLLSSIVGMIILFIIFREIHFKNLSLYPFIVAGILLAVPIGIVFHVIFGTNTTLNYFLGLSNKPKK
jgi:hypothetical protein